MPSKLLRERLITGVPAAKVKTNPFVMVAIRAANLRLRLLRQPGRKQCISVAANTPKTELCVTGHTPHFNSALLEA